MPDIKVSITDLMSHPANNPAVIVAIIMESKTLTFLRHKTHSKITEMTAGLKIIDII